MSGVSAAMGPRVRKARVEELLRRARRRSWRSPEKRERAQKAIELLNSARGAEFADVFLDAAEERHEQYLAADGEDSDTPIIDFAKWLLDWFLEHLDELLAMLLPLFV